MGHPVDDANPPYGKKYGKFLRFFFSLGTHSKKWGKKNGLKMLKMA